MDAAAVDADVKLYKASAELLAELQAKLSLLLRAPNGRLREWVLHWKTSELIRLLDSFQEWPQLLDSVLADLVHNLVEAFLAYCMSGRDAYHGNVQMQVTNIEPLPRAISRLLYGFCKVRGHKIIVRLLNNEPKYIEPLLVRFQLWGQIQSAAQNNISWEERYIFLLWLSHLMLAPFELATISGFTSGDTTLPENFQELELPNVAHHLLVVATRHLYVPSKDREAASQLIVRLALRKDMQRLRLPSTIILWCTKQLDINDNHALTDQYRHVGLLTLLYGLTNSLSSTEAAPFIKNIFDTCEALATATGAGAIAARQAAPSRKFLIKIMRSSILHTIALVDAGDQDAAENLETMLEAGIQDLLDWLADSDTPVRQAASKALGMIVLKLEPQMAAEVIEAILGCLNDNVLLEDRQTGRLVAVTDIINIDQRRYKKNVNAVDALKWHGAMLTLGHVLFRRSPPPEQLSDVLEALLMGLKFEQRSNVGTSLGVGVRDAACFGIWSLARKYTTKEVEAASLSPATHESRELLKPGQSSTLQTVATELVVASCLDPSGNLRRGASAALQELIGRHPDTILEGISVVQRVDYHSVARRSRALEEVAEAVSKLGKIYHTNLLYSLLDWRGCRAVDAESRRQAASTIGKFFPQARLPAQQAFAKELTSQIADLKPSNVGTNAATRHGLLLLLAAILQSRCMTDGNANGVDETLSPLLRSINETTGLLTGRVTADLTHVLEATAKLVGAAAMKACSSPISATWSDFAGSAPQILDRCTTAIEDDLLAETVAQANLELFMLFSNRSKLELLNSWLPASFPRQRSTYTCKGRVASMALLFPLLISSQEYSLYARKIATFLAETVTSQLAIETKVNAMQAISSIFQSGSCTDKECTLSLVNGISVGLADYTVDQRGDVGSLLRLASIEAVQNFDLTELDDALTKTFAETVVKLSAEKLTKVRFAAWNCLRPFWASHLSCTPMMHSFDHQADISSFEYYRQLCQLLDIDWLRDHLMQGLVSSIAGGGDDISQTASSALISFLNDHDSTSLGRRLEDIMAMLLGQLRTLVRHEDREVVPSIDTLCLLIEQYGPITNAYLIVNQDSLLALINDLQTPVADIPRIQSLIRLLSQLSSIDAFGSDAADRISRKLLHKWPKVRQTAADAIFMIEPSAVQVEIDWNTPPMTNKEQVVALRKALGVAGRAAVKA